MKANAEVLEGNKVKLIVDLEEAEVDKAIDAAFKKISHQVNIPGFRPGKAPRKLVEARVGLEAARAQALNDSLPDYYVQALDETQTDAIASPEINITSGEKDGPVTFEAEVEVRPVPNIAGYDGLTVTVPNPVATDDDVDDHIERLRAQSGELEEVDREAKEGDFVTLDLNGTTEGEPVPGLSATDWSYEVGSPLQSLGEDFDGQVDGSKAGDVLEFSSVVPPNDQLVDFRVTVKNVNERKLPEVDDDWANEVSEFETVDELRADVRDRMSAAKKEQGEQALRTGVIEALANLVEDDDVPEALVDAEMRRLLQDLMYRLQSRGADLQHFLAATGQSEEDFVAQLRRSAVDGTRADLALRSLAAKEDLQADEAEVDAEVESLAGQLDEKVAKLRRRLERADQLPAIRSDLRKAKAVKWLMDHVELVDSDGKPVDREALLGDSTEREEAV